jgi:hypothetical protein
VLDAVPEAVRAIAWKAQVRLCRRDREMMAPGKPKQVVVTAIARELAGFVWAIACLTSDPPGCALAAPVMPEERAASEPLARAAPPGAERRGARQRSTAGRGRARTKPAAMSERSRPTG